MRPHETVLPTNPLGGTIMGSTNEVTDKICKTYTPLYPTNRIDYD
ncbi:MAG: hypothetical protein QXX60_07275 [Sulfolobales archaeon]